jgi:BirA family biotin operon repressor/biotin-[acetyl-CoA-carboxylase] ligase
VVKTLDHRLLQTLRAAGVHLPLAELARQLGTTAVTVRARIAELQAAGFEIEEHPTLGCRLIAAPDRLIADDLAERLGECSLVRELVVFEETGSTNELVLQRGRSGAAPGLVVFAERQTAGRGRFDHRWESASHRGLWFSLLVQPALPLDQWSRLTTWAAVAAAAAIERTSDQRASIKWPNDVFVGEKKVAGILIESGTDPAGKPFAVVGIGVNVNHEPADFPPELAGRATSLRLVAGHTFDRSQLAATLLVELNARLPRLGPAFPELVAEASARSLLFGRWVQLRTGAHLHEGMAEALDASGQLIVRAVDGTAQSCIAGEVTVLDHRPI